MNKFELSEDQVKKISEWYESIKPKIVEAQNPNFGYAYEVYANPVIDKQEPYYGTIGGGLTYSFTPTSVGMIIIVKESVTGEELNLTDYDSW
jgi:hypothetical protein